MVRNMIKLLVVVLSLALLGGCATGFKPIPAQDLNPKLKSGALVQKTNNFEMILDTSASMEEPSPVYAHPDTSPDFTVMTRPRRSITSSSLRGCSTTRSPT